MVGGSAALLKPLSSFIDKPVPYSMPNPGDKDAVRLSVLANVSSAVYGRECLPAVPKKGSSSASMGGGVNVSNDSRIELITTGSAGLALTRLGDFPSRWRTSWEFGCGCDRGL